MMENIENIGTLLAMGIGKRSIRTMTHTQNEMPPMIEIEEFNKKKVSEDFLESCGKAGELFKNDD